MADDPRRIGVRTTAVQAEGEVQATDGGGPVEHMHVPTATGHFKRVANLVIITGNCARHSDTRSLLANAQIGAPAFCPIRTQESL